MDQRYLQVSVEGVIDTETDVHICKRHDIRNRNRNVDSGRRAVRNGDRNVTGAVIIHHDCAGREIVSDGAQIGRNILQLQTDNNRSAASEITGSESETSRDGRTACDHHTVILWPARTGHAAGSLQGAHEIRGVLRTSVLHTETDGDGLDRKSVV